MAITLAVTGNGHFTGSSTALTTYAVTEDSTPIEASDTSGGTGTINFTVVEDPGPEGSILLMNDTVTLTDKSNGTTTGTVYSVATNNGMANISANARTNLLTAVMTVPPFTGTLSQAFTFYLSMAGITSGIVVDPSIASRLVTFQGFNGNLWDNLKQMTVIQQVEISLVSNNIVLRPIRTFTVQTGKGTAVSRTTANADLAQTVQAYWYSNNWQLNGVVYPEGGDSTGVSGYQVDAGATLHENIPVNASLTSINQPVCVASTGIPIQYFGTTSVYTVAGQDGTPINPTVWRQHGGNISVAIGADQMSVDITINGAVGLPNAPYTIGVSAADNTYHSGLFITGSGTFFEPQMLTLPTGSPLAKTATVIGATVNNRFCTSYVQAWGTALRTAQKWAAPAQTITLSATVFNRPGQKGDLSYPTFGQVDSANAGLKYAQVDSHYAGYTFAQVDDDVQLIVANDFTNQAFGNIAGARVLYREAWYRVKTATLTEQILTLTAEIDTTFGDVDSVWSTKTFAQFNTRWAGKTFQDAQVIPLWT